ncbi:hypothetical protein A2U01_0078339, partial [Trifolium medium]|nr:hypothetical protein [Trifolium medium]
CSCSDMDVLMI